MRRSPCALMLAFVLAGCDFFQELQSLPEAGEEGTASESAGETGGTGETGETGDDGPCDVLDESCPNQDTLLSCDLETGELVQYDCAALCQSGNLLNFTCTPTMDFSHGCWCVEPGAIKIESCSQLESCVIDCGGDPSSDCANDCFTHTDAQTIRLLGTLYSCADRACDPLCLESPLDCGACLIQARAGLYGDCGLERQVCNADQTDEPSWP